jgi:glycosyltransferase involved in cell wall biosynthesis
MQLEHVGLTQARKTGIDSLKSGYVLILDADEILSKEYISLLVALIEEKKASFV